MKKQNLRINIPLNPTLLILLAAAIKAQHGQLGKNSPLTALEWDTLAPLIDEAATADAKLTALQKEVEVLSGRRQVLLDDTLTDFVRSSRDILLGVFRKEPRLLIDFGFDVSDTPRVKKPADGSDKKVA